MARLNRISTRSTRGARALWSTWIVLWLTSMVAALAAGPVASMFDSYLSGRAIMLGLDSFLTPMLVGGPLLVVLVAAGMHVHGVTRQAVVGLRDLSGDRRRHARLAAGLGVAWFALLATALLGATMATLVDLAPGAAVSDMYYRSRSTGGDVMAALLLSWAVVLVPAVFLHPLIMRSASRHLSAAVE